MGVDYAKYIRSPKWKAKRAEVILRAGGTCERCSIWPVVNVHHLTYARLGDERLTDLMGVCAMCHDQIHKEGKQVASEQLVFDEFLEGDYAPRDGFVTRAWQLDCERSYLQSVRAAAPGEQHRFCVYAGTGAGKTKAAGLIAGRMLNARRVTQVVVVSPTRTVLHKTRREFLKWFGIELAKFSKLKHAAGVPRMQQGYALTYQALMSDPVAHRRLCGAQTLVIFDEIHHLGDEGSWGEGAVEAFANVGYVLALTGTPFRSDNRPIPFVTYEREPGAPLARFRAAHPTGYTYSLGRAVSDGVCRTPLFEFHSGEVVIRTPEAGELRTDFEDATISEKNAAVRLRGVVTFGSPARRAILASALAACKREGRKVVIFLGGDTDGDETPTQDATLLLPQELEELGYDAAQYEIVTGDDPDAQAKIESFGPHPDKWILVTIKMVSEGTDIPEVSAAVFLTSIIAKQTTVQRVGRALRLTGEDDPHVTANIYMFGDSNLRAIAAEIDAEIKQEIDLQRKRREASAPAPAGPDDQRPRRAEVVCVGGGELSSVIMRGREYPAARVAAARERCQRLGLPGPMLYAMLELIEAQDTP